VRGEFRAGNERHAENVRNDRPSPIWVAGDSPTKLGLVERFHLRGRQWLAVIRLALFFILGCALVVAGGLLWRTTLEVGAGLNRTLPPASDPSMAVPFVGVTVQLAGRPTNVLKTRLAELHRAGIGWVRQRFDWREIEPEPGVFDWTETDRLVHAIAQAGLVPIAVLDGTPDWALAPVDRAARNGLAPPVDFVDYARFAAAFAARYGDPVRYYQIWDEPNIAPHWGQRHINPVGYAHLLRTAAPAIRSSDADAVVLSAALAPTVDRGHLAIDEEYFLQRMIAAGAAPYFDAVAIQPFGFGDSPANARQGLETLNFARAALIRRALVDAGLGNKPIWAVRYGWNRLLNSPWGTVTPVDQAAYAVAALDRAWDQWPWLATMGWAIDQPAEAPGLPTWGFALTDTTGHAAPVFDALAAWQKQPHTRAYPSSSVPVLGWVAWLLAVALIGWRSLAAARLIDWSNLLVRYRLTSCWLHMGAWVALMVIYYLATFSPLIVLCWLAAAMLCLVQPRVGLWLAVMLIPFFYAHKEFQLVGATLTVPPTHVLAAALLPATYLATQHRLPYTLRPAPLFWWELAPLLLLPMSLLSTVHVWHWPAFIRGTLDLVVIPLILWLEVRVLATTAADRRSIFLALMAGGGLAAVVGLVGWLHGDGTVVDGMRRLMGPHFSPNHTALYLERTLFLSLAALLVVARHPRALAAGAAAVVAAALVLTGSRGALLLGVPAGMAVLAGLALYRHPSLWQWARRRRPWVIAGVLLAGLAALAVVQWQRERLANVETIGLRIEVWQAALAHWRDHFWSGVGPGGFFWSYPAYLRPDAAEVDQFHPHSLWLELVTTWGILGLAWFAVSSIALVTAMQRQGQSSTSAFWIAAGVCAAFAAALAHAQIDTFLLLADLAAWNAVAWVLATAPTAD